MTKNLKLENFEFIDITPACAKTKRPKVLIASYFGHKIKLLNISRDNYRWLLVCPTLFTKDILCNEVEIDLLEKEVLEIINRFLPRKVTVSG